MTSTISSPALMTVIIDSVFWILAFALEWPYSSCLIGDGWPSSPARGRFMATLTMRRIHHDKGDAGAELARLRQQLSLQADVVSPRGRQLTEQVFGQALTPAQVVERICGDVRARGLPA